MSLPVPSGVSEIPKISVTKEQREKEQISEAEASVLMLLYNAERGLVSGGFKLLLLVINKGDSDEVEEALTTLRSEAYIRYSNKKWFITDDGKKFLESFATIENEKVSKQND